MAIVSTELIITSTDSAFSIPGDWTPQQLVANYSANIPGLSSMSYTTTTETRAEGEVKIVTFSPKVGNKGAL